MEKTKSLLNRSLYAFQLLRSMLKDEDRAGMRIVNQIVTDLHQHSGLWPEEWQSVNVTVPKHIPDDEELLCLYPVDGKPTLKLAKAGGIRHFKDKSIFVPGMTHWKRIHLPQETHGNDSNDQSISTTGSPGSTSADRGDSADSPHSSFARS